MEALNGSNFTSNATLNISDVVANVTSESVLPLHLRVPSWCVTVSQIYICIVVFFGFLDNSLLLAVFKRDKKRPSTTIYMIGLAVINLVALFIGLIDFLQNTSQWSSAGSIWICALYFYARHNVFAISAILIFCIGLDRYLRVYKPHSSQKLLWVSKRLCPMIFGFSVTIFVPVFTMVNQDEWSQCQFNRDSNPAVETAYMILSFAIIASLFPLCFFYFKIAQFVRSKHRIAVNDGHSAQKSLGKTGEEQNFADRANEHLRAQQTGVSITTNKQEHANNTLVCGNVPHTTNHLTKSEGRSKVIHVDVQESTLTPIESVEHSGRITTLPDSGGRDKLTPLHNADVGQSNKMTTLSSIGGQVPPESEQTKTNKPNNASGEDPTIITPSTSGQQYRRTALARSGREESRRQTNPVGRTTLAMALITIVFFLTTVCPIIILYFFSDQEGKSLGVDILVYFTLKLPFLNYALNASLYAVSSTEFRQKVKQLFRDIWSKIRQRF